MTTSDQLRMALRQRREALGRNQTEVAAAIGVPRGTFHGWESGDRGCSVEEFEDWAKALGSELMVFLRVRGGS